MSSIRCPHCQGALEFVPQLAGQQATCSYCAKPFMMPQVNVTNNPAPEQVAGSQTPNLGAKTTSVGPPKIQSESTGASSKTNRNPYRSGASRGLEPAASILDAITDVKLKKAVTPIIAPVIWAAMLGYFGLLLVDHLIWFIRSFTENGGGPGVFTLPEQILYLFSDLPAGLLRLIITIFDILTGIFLFLVARIFVEGLVVAFSILKTLKGIEAK